MTKCQHRICTRMQLSLPATTSNLSTEPLVGLDEINWAQITDAHGTAEDLPKHLKQLQSSDPEEYISAGDNLFSDICSHGTRYEASAKTVPFLYALISTSKTMAREALLNLLVYLAVGQPSLYVPTGIDLEKWKDRIDEIQTAEYAHAKTQEVAQWVLQATCETERRARRNSANITSSVQSQIQEELYGYETYCAVEIRVSELIKCLGDSSVNLRIAAAYALAFFPRQADITTGSILGLLAEDSESPVRGTAALAVAILHAPLANDSARSHILQRLQHCYKMFCSRYERDAVTLWSCAAALVIAGSREKCYIEEVRQAVTSSEYVTALETSIGHGVDFPFASDGLKALAEKTLAMCSH